MIGRLKNRNAARSSRTTRGSQRGFTLIELMMVVAIMAILAVTAIFSYDWAMKKTRRGAAMGCLTERSQFMERYYATNFRYDQTAPPVGAAVVLTEAQLPTCATNTGDFYTMSAAFTATTFTLQAQAIGTQAADTACAIMTINQQGIRAPAAGCW